jgi:hypothetical protein
VAAHGWELSEETKYLQRSEDNRQSCPLQPDRDRFLTLRSALATGLGVCIRQSCTQARQDFHWKGRLVDYVKHLAELHYEASSPARRYLVAQSARVVVDNE